MNLLEMFVKGGMIMYPILLCSLVAVYVVIERYLALRKAQLDVGQFMLKIKSILQRGDIDGVHAYCSDKNAPIAAIIRRGITKHDQGEEKMRVAVEDAGRAEVYHLERGLSWLASIAGIAPMLGFLGTVTGMVSAFQAIETLGGVVNPSDLAGGIWEALITTVFGLVVGIPAAAAYNYFVTRVARFVHDMEVATTEFLDVLERHEREAPAARAAELSRAGRPALAADDDQFFRRKG